MTMVDFEIDREGVVTVEGPVVRSLRDEQHVTGGPGAWRLAVPMFGKWVQVHIGPP